MAITRDDGLEGKVAVISGGSSGIGLALALAYARAGAHTVINYLPSDPHDPTEAERQIIDAGGKTTIVAADVRSTEQVDALAQTAMDEYGRLDIAVAAAGILRRNPIDEMTDESWEIMMDVDLTGVMRVFRACSKFMTDGGAMVATSSIAGGVYGWEDHAHYAAAKSGVLGLCRSLASELGERRIRVNSVIPGLIESPQSLDAVNSLGPEGLKAAGKLIPWGRVGTVDECARVIRFLTSDDGAYVTGQQLIVDGGLTIKWPS